MWCKIIGSVLIGVSSYAIGIWWSGTLRNRVEDIRDLEQVLQELINEISFYSNILQDAFTKIAKGSKSRISCILTCMADNLNMYSGKKAWMLAVGDNYKSTYLSNEDIDVLLSLGDILGTSDTDGQVGHIKNIIARLVNQESKAEDTRKRNEELFCKLSILLGLTIVILLL